MANKNSTVIMLDTGGASAYRKNQILFNEQLF